MENRCTTNVASSNATISIEVNKGPPVELSNSMTQNYGEIRFKQETQGQVQKRLSLERTLRPMENSQMVLKQENLEQATSFGRIGQVLLHNKRKMPANQELIHTPKWKKSKQSGPIDTKLMAILGFDKYKKMGDNVTGLHDFVPNSPTLADIMNKPISPSIKPIFTDASLIDTELMAKLGFRVNEKTDDNITDQPIKKKSKHNSPIDLNIVEPHDMNSYQLRHTGLNDFVNNSPTLANIMNKPISPANKPIFTDASLIDTELMAKLGFNRYEKTGVNITDEPKKNKSKIEGTTDLNILEILGKHGYQKEQTDEPIKKRSKNEGPTDMNIVERLCMGSFNNNTTAEPNKKKSKIDRPVDLNIVETFGVDGDQLKQTGSDDSSMNFRALNEIMSKTAPLQTTSIFTNPSIAEKNLNIDGVLLSLQKEALKAQIERDNAMARYYRKKSEKLEENKNAEE